VASSRAPPAACHAERRCNRLKRAELASPGGNVRIANDCRSRHPGSHLLEQLQPFPADAVFDKPVTLPPGRARLLTKPAPTGSATCTNTIGTLRVACNNGATVTVPEARRASGSSATMRPIDLPPEFAACPLHPESDKRADVSLSPFLCQERPFRQVLI
jgi:hypothetical protein